MTDNEYVDVKDSSIHGKGLFAKKFIPAGTNIIEYVGEKISKEEGDRRSEEQDQGPGPILVFELDDEYDIDASVGGSDAKYANHGCDGNCEVEVEEGRIWLKSVQDIQPDEELTYDYNFSEDAGEHKCACGSQDCRGTINREEDEEDLEVGQLVGVEHGEEEFFGIITDLQEDDEASDHIIIKREDTGEDVAVHIEDVFIPDHEHDEECE